MLSLNAGDIAPTVIEAVNKVGSVFFGPVLAVFLLGISSKRVNSAQVNRALICGVVTNLIFAFFVSEVFWFWWNITGFVSTVIPALLQSFFFSGKKRKIRDIVQSEERTLPSDKVVATVLLGYFVLLVFICHSLPEWLL